MNTCKQHRLRFKERRNDDIIYFCINCEKEYFHNIDDINKKEITFYSVRKD